MRDPFSILGVSRESSDDEIKKAYRRLARENHPDKFTDPAERERAEERMKEINAAYEEIRKIRSGRAQDSYYGGGTYNESSSTGDDRYVAVRVHINARRVREAEAVLASIPQTERDAEWYFLMGCVVAHKGYYMDAQQYFDTACSMDPDNTEYRNAQQHLRERMQSNPYGGGSSSQAGCSCCDICAGLMCLDCCCSMSRC